MHGRRDDSRAKFSPIVGSEDPESRELRRDRVSSRGRYRVGVFFGIRLECCRLPVSVQQRTVRSVARRRKYGNCALRTIADINHYRETLSDAVTYPASTWAVLPGPMASE